MQSVKVKICGITNFGDALQATAAGADFLGFIFHQPSKRSILPEEAVDIVSRLRESTNSLPRLVGVFVDEEPSKIVDALVLCQLDMAQLSGKEVPALVGDPASPLFKRCYKAIQPRSLAEAEAEAEWFYPPEPDPRWPAILLDSYHPTMRGGTGLRADWQVASKLAADYSGLMLAGGLNHKNVSNAIAQVRPFAVDVASGVESSPGQKDHKKVMAFITAVKSTVVDEHL